MLKEQTQKEAYKKAIEYLKEYTLERLEEENLIDYEGVVILHIEHVEPSNNCFGYYEVNNTTFLYE